MSISRRGFLAGLGTGLTGVLAGSLAPEGRATENLAANNKQFHGILVDTTRCIGCLACESACAETKGLQPAAAAQDVFNRTRDTAENQLTVVNRFKTSKGEVFVKKQCFHCNQAGCVAACLVRSMKKQKEGAVTWDTNCMGCRYCMVSCPFDIPKFEYGSANPRIMKCDLCYPRTIAGKLPACVEACPAEALSFGTRRGLIGEANSRIYQNKDAYYHHIYGHHEVGGTSFLYLSAVPFDEIGFRTDLGNRSFPEYTKGFLYSVPVVLLLFPALMYGISQVTRSNKNSHLSGDNQ